MKVFICSTTAGLSQYRDFVASCLNQAHINFIVQDNLGTDRKTLDDLLRDRIGQCDVVICLLGPMFGARVPQDGYAGVPESYTQLEYRWAKEKGKDIFIFLATEDCEGLQGLKPEEPIFEQSQKTFVEKVLAECQNKYYCFNNKENFRTICSEVIADLAKKCLSDCKNIPENVIIRKRQQHRTPSIQDDTAVMFTTYHPKEVRRSTPYVLLAFAHLERAMEEVQREANQNIELMGNNAREVSTPSRIQVVKDEIITVIPQMHGIEFQPKQHILAWNPPIQSCNFLFTVPENANLPLHGRIVFYRGPILAGEIDLTLEPVISNTRTDPRSVESIARSISPVFASYSHRDSRVMEYFRRRSRQFGQNMLVDIYDIRSGQRWEKRLLEMIDQSAVFQLFWSRHSVTSKYCRMEWEYALERSAQRDREAASRASTELGSTQCSAVDQSPYIRPVWWEKRLPPQPKELQHLHFERVSIPPAGLTGVLLRTAKWCADCLHKK